MTAHYRHGRSYVATIPFPTPIAPGEIVVNPPNRQIAVGDQSGGTQPLIAVRYFSATAQYTNGDVVVNGGQVFRAIAPVAPGAFNPANWVTISDDLSQYVQKAGATMTGALMLNADPLPAGNPNQAATRNYVDAGVGACLPLKGGTLTGPLFLSGDPTSTSPPNQAATKHYVDSNIGTGPSGPVAASSVSNQPAGNITATNVQDALNALDTAKLSSITLSGDVTTPAGGTPFAATIANGAITFVKMAAAAIATTAQYLSNTAQTILTTDQVWAAAVPVTLSGINVTPNFSAGINFNWVLTGTCTLNNPTALKVGQTGIIYLQQDSTGNRQIGTWGSYYKFPGGMKPTLSTAANTGLDILNYAVRSATEVECTFAGGMA